jgi:hypothetical protein
MLPVKLLNTNLSLEERAVSGFLKDIVPVEGVSFFENCYSHSFSPNRYELKFAYSIRNSSMRFFTLSYSKYMNNLYLHVDGDPSVDTFPQEIINLVTGSIGRSLTNHPYIIKGRLTVGWKIPISEILFHYEKISDYAKIFRIAENILISNN